MKRSISPPTAGLPFRLLMILMVPAVLATLALPAVAAPDASLSENPTADYNSAANPDEDPDGEEAEAVEPQITISTTTWCGYCRKTRSLLAELEVEFTDKDVESDEQAQREFREIAGPRAGVPLVLIGDTVIRGYNETKIRSAIDSLESE